MTKARIYETRPFACWQKAKELRLRHYQRVRTARDDGILLATGWRGVRWELLAGFGDLEFLGINDYGASVANGREFAMDCFQAVENRGYSRDLCGYARAYMGSMFLDRFAFGGAFPRPDLVFTILACDGNGKNTQVISDHLGIPFLAVDYPLIVDYPNPSRQRRVDYLVAQMHDLVAKGEEALKRPYDDERLILAIRNSCESESLWAETMQMNRAVPATMDLKSQFTLFAPIVLSRHQKQTVDFYRELRDEVRDRVDAGIAALPVERRRLLHEGVPPWFLLRLFRVPEEFGAVFVGSHYTISMFGAFEEDSLGGWVRSKTPGELGLQLRSRDDAFRFLASWWLDRADRTAYCTRPQLHSYLSIARDWHADGMVFHLDRGCRMRAAGVMEIKLAVSQKLGIPTMVYEGNAADFRECSEAVVIDQLESFLESLGLSRSV